MRPWLRRIRGAVGVGFTWGVAWSAVGMIPRWVLGFNPDAPFPLIFGVLGFFAGVTFSGLLVLTEGRRRFDQMSLPRFADGVPSAAFCYRPSSPRPRPLAGETCS